MKVDFELNDDDCLAGMVESTKRQQSYEYWFFFWRWATASVAFVSTGWLLWRELGVSSLVVGSGIAAIVVQVMPWFLRRRLRANLRRHLSDPKLRSACVGKFAVELSPEGMKLSGPKRQVFYKWPVVESIERQDARVMVFFDGFGGVAIPASAMDVDAFIAEARRCGYGTIAKP
jgi:hypothetical protein